MLPCWDGEQLKHFFCNFGELDIATRSTDPVSMEEIARRFTGA